jgi:hypothetical protein
LRSQAKEIRTLDIYIDRPGLRNRGKAIGGEF